MYLTLIYLFFPETKRLSIEEVSVIFDTGRLGNVDAVRAEFASERKNEGSVSEPTHVEKPQDSSIEEKGM